MKIHGRPLALVAVLLLLSGACKTAPKAARAVPADPGSTRPRMFWTMRAPGGSIVSIQGTIHLGNAAIVNPDIRVIEAFDDAGTLIAELSDADVSRSQRVIVGLLDRSALPAGKTLRDYLPPRDSAVFEKLLGPAMFDQFATYKPWFMYTVAVVADAARLGYDPSLGLDLALYKRAQEQGRKVRGLDTIESQMSLLADRPFLEQLAVARDFARESREDPHALERLYALYLGDDREGLAAFLETEREQSAAYETSVETFNRALLDERNAAWAERIATEAAKGEALFVFAGAAHFLGKRNVLELLAARGFRELRPDERP